MARRFNKKATTKAAKPAAQSATSSPAFSPTPSGSRRKPPLEALTCLISAILFMVVLAVFWPCTNNGFINYDDNVYVTENTHVQQGLNAQSVAWAFQSGETSNWHPLTWMSHMLDCQFYGLKPAGHHFTSVLLHSINAVLLFLVLHLMTGARWRSLAVAVLFALHPLRVESVAWVAERKDVLSMTLWLLTIWAHIRFARALKSGGGFRLFYGLALVFFALALMSKPMVVTLPFVLLLLDYWPLRRIQAGNWRMALLEKIPYFALSAICCLLTFKFQHAYGAVASHLPLYMRIETAHISYFRYLGKLLWPSGLAINYPYPGHWPMAAVCSTAIALVAISLLAAVCRRNRPWLAVGWFWYVGTLVPVIGLVQVGMQSMADRYTYIPGIGMLLLLVWGASEAWQRCRLPASALTIPLVASLAVCVFLTRRQIVYWQNDMTVFSHAIEVTANNEVAYSHLGDHLLKHGEPQQAMAMFRESIRINPRLEQSQAALGYLLFLDGQREAAIHQLEQAVTILPDSAAIRSNLGLCYKEQGRYAEAVVQLQEALRLRPQFPEAQVGLAAIWLKQGRRAEAILLLKQALQARPGLPVAERMLRQATAAASPNPKSEDPGPKDTR
jgi:Tfp pilus assembly protein PilF